MKAEHRKELQTNLLADRMGRLVKQIQTKPKRRAFLYVVLVLAVLIGLFVFYRIRQSAAQERAELWVMLEDGFKPYIDKLKKDNAETNPGKAARFQYAWLATWDLGLKILGTDPARALENLEIAQAIYRQLSKECAEDPIWEPEALFGMAVIEETMAVRQKDRGRHLDNALTLYKELADKHKTSAHGKMAARRAELLEKNRPEIISFYDDLQNRLRIPEEKLKLPEEKPEKTEKPVAPKPEPKK